MAPLASVAELETHLRRDTLDDPAAELAVAGASGAVRAYCGWSIDRETATFTLDGTGSRILSLPTLMLVDVIEVSIDGQVLERGVLQPGQYNWSRRGQLYRAAGWPGRFRSIDVECVHGYDPVPDVVRLVVLSMAAREYDNPSGLRSVSSGSISRTFDLTALDMALLDTYRLP